MVAVIPLMTYFYTRKIGEPYETMDYKTRIFKLLPLFIIGFLVFAIIRSIGDASINAGNNAFSIWDSIAWKEVHNYLKTWAVRFLVVALAGVGLSTRFSQFKGLGKKPFLIGLGAALTVGIVSYIAISLLGTFVEF